jgi:hypothetical protein
VATGISGNYIAGTYIGAGAQSFLYDINSGTYTSLSVPGAMVTSAYGISGNNIVGFYANDGYSSGFLATPAPEPSALALLAVMAAPLAIKRWRRSGR